PGPSWFLASGGFMLAGVFMIGLPARRRHGITMLVLAVAVSLTAAVGCGGGSSAAPPSTPAPVVKQTTSATSYTVTVTAASTTGGLSHSTGVIVTVQ
ncbi:MAG: hypothetical protein JOY93_03950, partial [Acidobacteriales bacterium]|nr:hypothetical protein [Terriglobales bacterium]